MIRGDNRLRSSTGGLKNVGRSRPFFYATQTLCRISEADSAKCDFGRFIVGIDEPSVMFAVKYLSS